MPREIIFEIIKIAIMIVSALVARYLIPWIKENTDSTKLYRLMRWAKEAVYAAEQIYGAGTGTEKKKYAAELIYKIAQANKINITEEELNLLIEAAVGAMNSMKLEELVFGDTSDAGEPGTNTAEIE